LRLAGKREVALKQHATVLAREADDELGRRLRTSHRAGGDQYEGEELDGAHGVYTAEYVRSSVSIVARAYRPHPSPLPRGGEGERFDQVASASSGGSCSFCAPCTFRE